VVGENDLLAEIFKEEEDLRIDLEKIYSKLQAARTKLEVQVLSKLIDNKETETDRGNKATRADEVKKMIHMNGQDIGTILAAFRRISQEMEFNKVQRKNIGRIQNEIYTPLQEITDKNRGDFKKAEDAAENLAQVLEKNLQNRDRAGQDARDKLDTLIARLKKVLDSMQNIVDKDAVIKMGIEIEQKQRKQTETLKAHEDYLKEIFAKELEGKE